MVKFFVTFCYSFPPIYLLSLLSPSSPPSSPSCPSLLSSPLSLLSSLLSPSSLPLLSSSQFVQCLKSLLDKSPKQPVDLECVRIFLTMTASPIFSVKELEWALELFIKYCQVLIQLQPKALEVLGQREINIMTVTRQPDDCHTTAR